MITSAQTHRDPSLITQCLCVELINTWKHGHMRLDRILKVYVRLWISSYIKYLYVHYTMWCLLKNVRPLLMIKHVKAKNKNTIMDKLEKNNYHNPNHHTREFYYTLGITDHRNITHPMNEYESNYHK